MGKKAIIITASLILLVLASSFLFSSKNASGFEAIGNYDGDIKIYKSGSCGCCGVYSTYFKNEGNKGVKVIDLEYMQGIKEKYGVPSNLESCHTTIIGDYFVEGHIPLEAIERLMQEKPTIKGIAMPGMPSGSPGMPGAKIGDFVIYAVNNDGGYVEWMRI